MGKNKKKNKIKQNIFPEKLTLAIISAAIGAVLASGGILFIQHTQNKNNKINLHKKLAAEINDNIRHGAFMAMLGDFKGFQTKIWKEFHGSSAFREIPVAPRDLLEKYYFFLKIKKDYPSAWKQLEEKTENEMTMESLNTLTKEYFSFLEEKEIWETQEIISQKNIKKINFSPQSSNQPQ